MGVAARILFRLERRGTRSLEDLVTAAKAAAKSRGGPAAGGRSGNFVKVGLLGTGKARDPEPGEPATLTNVEIGIIHEFGAPEHNIPERSFLRATINKNRPEYMALLAKLTQTFLRNRDPSAIRRALGLVGQRAAADVKKFITAGEPISPPNTPEVFLRKLKKNEKGFNRSGLAPRTLVDTGQLVNSITYEVVGEAAPTGGGEKP